MSEAFATEISMMVWKAATIGLVMSLANPHRANNDVMSMNVKRYFFDTKGFFI